MSTLATVNVALQHFAETDPCIHAVCESAFASEDPPLLPLPKPVDQYFSTLVNSIVSQQISTKAAAAIYKRLSNSVTLTPAGVQAFNEEVIKSCGVTKQKTRYIKSLAIDWDALQVETFADLSDAEVIARLSACYGIGRWTAEMFLLFAMARPDVFSVGDLGLRQQVSKHYDVSSSNHAAIRDIAAKWSPHRSVASLALWHEIDNGPVLL